LYTFLLGDSAKTEVLSVRVRKSLKDEADRMGIDVKASLETLLEEMVSARKEKAAHRADELSRLMGITTEEWADAVKKTREEE
jgi:antitoxin component of RelBE/YafQ-DinJ toxin-antitoxin module